MQYLASSNSTFNLSNFLDKGGVQGKHSMHYNKHVILYTTVVYISILSILLHTVIHLNTYSYLCIEDIEYTIYLDIWRKCVCSIFIVEILRWINTIFLMSIAPSDSVRVYVRTVYTVHTKHTEFTFTYFRQYGTQLTPLGIPNQLYI